MLPDANNNNSNKKKHKKIKKWKETRPEKLCCLFLELLLRHRQSSGARVSIKSKSQQNCLLFSPQLLWRLCRLYLYLERDIFSLELDVCVSDAFASFWTHNPKVHLLYWPIKCKQTALSLFLKIVCARTIPDEDEGARSEYYMRKEIGKKNKCCQNYGAKEKQYVRLDFGGDGASRQHIIRGSEPSRRQRWFQHEKMKEERT